MLIAASIVRAEKTRTADLNAAQYSTYLEVYIILFALFVGNSVAFSPDTRAWSGGILVGTAVGMLAVGLALGM
ncbi:hypothetical protein [Krasilnikovia sp. MM14-A1259]|uniref:hypothetical protein n=1 Tax=Krasilnikovia sp. MM14-A1259 TaxID=3373539 RepID=UPI00380343E9